MFEEEAVKQIRLEIEDYGLCMTAQGREFQLALSLFLYLSVLYRFVFGLESFNASITDSFYLFIYVH